MKQVLILLGFLMIGFWAAKYTFASPQKQEHDVVTYQRVQDSIRISHGVMISPYYYSLQDGEIVYKSRVEPVGVWDSINKANHYIPELDDNP